MYLKDQEGCYGGSMRSEGQFSLQATCLRAFRVCLKGDKPDYGTIDLVM